IAPRGPGPARSAGARHAARRERGNAAFRRIGPEDWMNVKATEKRVATTLRAALFAAMPALAVGCGSDANDAAEGARGTSAGPLYAVMYEVYDDVGSNSYLSLLSSLDLEEVDLSQVREYPGGRAFIQAYDGALFVGDAASPTVTRYTIDEKGEL